MKSTGAAALNGNDTATACTDVVSDDDEYYMELMSQILDTFPQSGPPSHPGRVSKNIYIGNQDNADDMDLLPALGIAHVLNMAGTRNFDATRSPYKPKVGIKSFLMIQAEDYDDYDISSHFAETAAFLDRARATGDNALVHCSLGVNRSGAIVAAYLMTSERRPLLQVVADLKAKRSLIIANVGFRRQLVRYARCRGFLDAVDRQTYPHPPGRSLASNGIHKTEKMDRKNRVTASNCEDKMISQDSGSNEVNVGKTSGVVSNSDSADTSSYRFQTGVSGNGRYTSANIADLVSTARRERLLNDVDAVIEKMSHDNNEGESGGSDSVGDTAEEDSETSTVRSRLTSCNHRQETNGSNRYRRTFETETSPMSTVNLVGSLLSDRLITTTPVRYDVTSSYNCSTYIPCRSRNYTSYLDTHPSQTNIDNITRVDSYATLGSYRTTTRPMSAQSVTSVGSRKCFEYDVTSKPAVDRYNIIPRSGYRRNHEEDDVATFLEEADRRSQLSSISAATKKYALPVSYVTSRPRSTRTNSSSRVTSLRNLSIDHSSDDSDEDLRRYSSRRLTCGRVVPTRVTPAPATATHITSRFTGANGYL